MQYRLGVRLRDVAPVMRYAQCIVTDHSCHWSDVQKPQPQPVLRIHHLSTYVATTAPRRRIEPLTEHVFDPNSSTAESCAY